MMFKIYVLVFCNVWHEKFENDSAVHEFHFSYIIMVQGNRLSKNEPILTFHIFICLMLGP